MIGILARPGDWYEVIKWEDERNDLSIDCQGILTGPRAWDPHAIDRRWEPWIKCDLKSSDAILGRQNITQKITETEKEDAGTKRFKESGRYPNIVAMLMATVTFAAGFTVPGGYDGNPGPSQGMAILTREAAFKAFIVIDATALICSMSAIRIQRPSRLTELASEIAAGEPEPEAAEPEAAASGAEAAETGPSSSENRSGVKSEFEMCPCGTELKRLKRVDRHRLELYVI
ncbi:hypothetical protein RHSIM_Rhsim01G0003100 [Rhododendron simsii]|uniref:PGG domain-containing protein n=1 Tax=Rhododendron simsii TaxID=118357 RepID=A0A834M0H4_RHOSS|nr:hypothetical protein RHSIM_Rhsim01G0003100 [Rhododendron simsii]